jgi:type I restriction enzyme R subunit
VITKTTESTLESSALDWLQDLGYQTSFAPELAPGTDNPERESYQQVLLSQRLRAALRRINPGAPTAAIESAIV